MRQPGPRVAVIVINWNGADATIDCLRSLAAGVVRPWRAYVVDNASRDDSVERIRAACPETIVLAAGRNRGYAGGFNLGRARALADGANFLWLLNNDVVVCADALAALLDGARRGGEAIFAPLILRQDDPAVVWSAGGYLDWKLKSFHYTSVAGTDLPEVPWATGCSLFCSTAVARRVGPMDERYFLYLEDVDWCLRARARGVTVRLVPGARIYHGISRSMELLGRARLAYYSWRNYYLLIQAHGRWWQRLYASGDLGSRYLKIAVRHLVDPPSRRDPVYAARTRGLLDVARGRFGESLLAAPRRFADAARAPAEPALSTAAARTVDPEARP